MTTPAGGRWDWNTIFGDTELNLYGSTVILSFPFTDPIFSTVDGLLIRNIWGTPLDQNVGPIVLPPVYNSHRQLIPYRQHLRFAGRGGTGILGSAQILQHDPAMYSTTEHLEVRFLDLMQLGQVEPGQLTVEGAAVLIGIGAYDPAAFTSNGVRVDAALRTGSVGGLIVRQDWPPMYDQDWNVIPYRQTFRFSGNQASVPQGSFTIVDIVPN